MSKDAECPRAIYGPPAVCICGKCNDASAEIERLQDGLVWIRDHSTDVVAKAIAVIALRSTSDED